MENGKILRVMGPVVDVIFSGEELPAIKDALEVEADGEKRIMEAAQHIGNKIVRCVMLSPSEGLYRDMEVKCTGRRN